MPKYVKVTGTKLADIFDRDGLGDRIKAGGGADVINGGAGADKIKAGDGSDVITGGGGNDTIDGGKGVDTAVYRGLIGEYSISFTVNGELKATVTDLVANRDGSDALKKVELLQFSNAIYDVEHDVVFLLNRAPTIVGSNPGGTVVEDDISQASGQVVAVDPDPDDQLSWTLDGAVDGTAVGGAFGTFDIGPTGLWSYVLDDSRAVTQALAEGQHASDTATVIVTDSAGASDSRVIMIDVIGTNDAPVMETGPVSRALVEDVSVTASGELTASGDSAFSDVDLIDTHTLAALLQSVTLSEDRVPAGLRSQLDDALSLTLVDAATGDGHGQFHWDFALPNDAVQFLSVNQTLTASYALSADDHHGGIATQIVTIAISGNDEAPVLI